MKEIIKITDIPNQKPPDLSERIALLYEKLITLSDAVSESSAQEISKNDAQLIIQTFQFILRNEAYIKNVVNGAWHQETERDKHNGVIRASNHISFHVNGYHNGEEAVKGLLSAIEEFLAAANVAKQYNALSYFINACEYNNNTGCLEERISKALTVSAGLQQNNGVSTLTQLMQEILSGYTEADQEDVNIFLRKIKEDTFAILNRDIFYKDIVQKTSWDIIKQFLLENYLDSENEEQQYALNYFFSPYAQYNDFIYYSDCKVQNGFHGMIKHIFSSEAQARYFKEMFLNKLDFFQSESALLKARVAEEHGKFVVRLTNAQVKKIVDTEIKIEVVDTNQTESPFNQTAFYAKTITGFINQDAWQHVVQGLTLLDKKEKPPFRNKGKINQTFFRVRVNPYKARYEVHDVKNASDSLHRTEKERRRNLGIAPLPPHQSFTYYDFDDDQFRPDFFQPTTLSDMQKKEMIGIRVKPEGAFINRIIAMDRGTATVFYGFKSKEKANHYIVDLEKSNAWATSLADLKKKKSIGSYNEVMLRANWCCDGSSQILIYPPYSDLAGRYMAILYRLDLEDHFKNHAEQYRQAPFHWKEGYEVPISFWRNAKNTAKESIDFYDVTSQEMDLKKTATTTRERFLKAAIDYKRCESKAAFVFDPKLIQDFCDSLGDEPSKLVDDFALLNWIGTSSSEFYTLFCNQIPLDALVNFIKVEIKNIKFFMNTRRMMIDIALMKSYINRLKDEDSNNTTLKEILLAGSPEVGPAVAIRDAAQNGHTSVVKALIEAALHLKEKDPTDTTLSQMLLAGSPLLGPALAIRLAIQNGHTGVVKTLIEAALHLKEKEPADTTLSEMLLAEYPGEGPAAAIRLAMQNGHTDIVKALIEAALRLKEKEPTDTTLSQMLLAGSPLAIQVAAQNGHTSVVKTLIEAALYLKEKEPTDTTLSQMLLAEHSDAGPAFAIRAAAQNGHIYVVKILIEAALRLKEKEPTDTTLSQMLLAGYPQKSQANAIRMATAYRHFHVVTVLFESALSLKAKDQTDSTFKESISAIQEYTTLHDCLRISPEGIQNFLEILTPLTKDEKKVILKTCQILFATSLKSEIIDALIDKMLDVNALSRMTPKDIGKLYKKQVSFFSFKKNQFQDATTIQSVIETLKSGAEQNFSGASMLTLLEMTISPQEGPSPEQEMVNK